MKKLLLILLVFVLYSCGARKVNKTVVSKTETTEQNSVSSEKEHTEINVRKEVVSVENSKDSTITEIVEIRPIDVTKPAYFDNNGKMESVTNAVYRKEKVFKTSSKNRLKVSDLNESLSKKTDKTVKDRSLTKNSFKQLDKKTEREQFSLWWWLVPAVIMVTVYIGYRKYKDCCVV